MSIAPEEFVPYMSAAFDGMLAIAEELGDARLNQRPQHMPNTSTPFAILTHCIGLTRYWLGTVIAAGRSHGTAMPNSARAAPWRTCVRPSSRSNRKSRPTSPMSRAISPRRSPAAVRPQHKEWTQGHFLIQSYKELAHTACTWS